jgi:hypothetical protein
MTTSIERKPARGRELVPSALLLAEDRAAAITGQAYNIDGGAAIF